MTIVRTSLILLALHLSATMPAAAAAARLPPHVQVLVIGGSPAGIAAAVTAARAGMDTLLVEATDQIGGDLTHAWLNVLDLNRAPNGMQLTQGIFLEVFRELGQTFDVTRAGHVFQALVRNTEHLRVRTRVAAAAPLIENGAVRGALLLDEVAGASTRVRAEIVIDAEDDAAFAVASGALYTVGRQDVNGDRRTQAATLIFRLSGIDRTRVVEYIRSNEEPARRGGVLNRYVWGYHSILRRYQPKDRQVAAYDLNLGWQSDGTVFVNALQVFGVDGTDPESMRAGRERAMTELPSLVEFLRQEAPGFERVRLVDAAPSLYIRETRHIIGLYRMSGQDIASGRDFEDRVAVASFPIDLHPFAPGQLSLLAPRRTIYAVPFRALIPLGVDNLLVVGKAISATRMAAGSLRIVATGMALGEAAGRAAAMAVTLGVTPAQIALNHTLISRLQHQLVQSGAFLASPDLIREALAGGPKSACLSAVECTPRGYLLHYRPGR